MEASAERNVWKHALKKPYEVLGGLIMSQKENGPIFLRDTAILVPNTDVGSSDDKRNALPLIQIIIRLRPIHVKAELEGRGQGGWTLCEREHQR